MHAASVQYSDGLRAAAKFVDCGIAIETPLTNCVNLVERTYPHTVPGTAISVSLIICTLSR